MPSAILLDVFNLIGLLEDVLLAVLAVVVALVASYLFVTMYHATLERRREIATMRALGARRGTVLYIVLLESCVVAALGGLVGIAGGHGSASLGANLLSLRGGPVTRSFALGALQPATFAAVVLLGRRCSRIARRLRSTLRRSESMRRFLVVCALVSAALATYAGTQDVPRLTFVQLADSMRANLGVTRAITAFNGREVEM